MSDEFTSNFSRPLRCGSLPRLCVRDASSRLKPLAMDHVPRLVTPSYSKGKCPVQSPETFRF